MWFGIIKGGNFVVFINYWEMDIYDVVYLVYGKCSCGGMVMVWFGVDLVELIEWFVIYMLEDGGVKGVGGFFLICGKFRKVKGDSNNIDFLVIILNCCDYVGQVLWICGECGFIYGLSNVIYLYLEQEDKEEELWFKIWEGCEVMFCVVIEKMDEKEFQEVLFEILDMDRFLFDYIMDFEEGILLFKDLIFIFVFGGKLY